MPHRTGVPIVLTAPLTGPHWQTSAAGRPIDGARALMAGFLFIGAYLVWSGFIHVPFLGHMLRGLFRQMRRGGRCGTVEYGIAFAPLLLFAVLLSIDRDRRSGSPRQTGV
ncbi:MAG TPA: hypothetical protein VGH34_00275 [Vicinamibacterales bacterium]|jgi:hypothetical protein